MCSDAAVDCAAGEGGVGEQPRLLHTGGGEYSLPTHTRQEPTTTRGIVAHVVMCFGIFFLWKILAADHDQTGVLYVHKTFVLEIK